MAHRTTIVFPDALHLRLRALSERRGQSLGAMVVELLGDVLATREGAFRSHAKGVADVDDLGRESEKYLREGLR